MGGTSASGQGRTDGGPNTKGNDQEEEQKGEDMENRSAREVEKEGKNVTGPERSGNANK